MDFIRHVIDLTVGGHLAGSQKLASLGGRARMPSDHGHQKWAQRQPVVAWRPPPMIRPDSAKRIKALSKISIVPSCASPRPLSTIDVDRRLRVHRKTYVLKTAWHGIIRFRVQRSDKVLLVEHPPFEMPWIRNVSGKCRTSQEERSVCRCHRFCFRGIAAVLPF